MSLFRKCNSESTDFFKSINYISIVNLILIFSLILFIEKYLSNSSLDPKTKNTLLEFVDSTSIQSFISHHDYKQQKDLVEIWELKKKIDDSIQNRSYLEISTKNLDSFCKKTKFVKKSETKKISVNCQTKNYREQVDIYFENNKCILYSVKNSQNELLYNFIKDDLMLYVSRIPQYCVLVDENYNENRVKKIKEYIQFINQVD